MSSASYKLFPKFFLPIIAQGIWLKFVYWNILASFPIRKNYIKFVNYERVTLIANIGKTTNK